MFSALALSMRHRSPRTAVTLIELMVIVLIGACMMHGCSMGIHSGGDHRLLWACLGAAGGLVGGLAALFLFCGFTSLIAGLVRLTRAAQGICTCGRGSATPAAAASPLAQVDGFASVELMRREGMEGLREWVERGGLDPSRVFLAASLGHPHASALSPGPPRDPPIHYETLARVPLDMLCVLRSGLPPRMIVAWTLACAERALAVFEEEFHEERRPREAWESSVRLLAGSVDAPPLEHTPSWKWNQGCRVFRRTAWERFCGRRTRVDYAAEAIQWTLQAARTFASPSGLWDTCAPHSMNEACSTAEWRCTASQPAFYAEYAAELAAKAAADPVAERAWQRTLLADMVLGWEPWDGDREAWQRRLEEEWIPRILRELRTTRFSVPSYLDRVRRDLAPWGSCLARP